MVGTTGYMNGYIEGGLFKTVTFNVTGNPNCSYKCYMTTPNGNYVEIGLVKGDGSQTANKFFYNLPSGIAYFTIMPFNGTVSGEYITVTITVT